MIASVGFLRTKLQLLHAICGVRETPLSSASAETIKLLAANTVPAKNPNARPSESCRETTERRNIGNSFYYRGESRTSGSVTIYSCCDHRRWRCGSSSKKDRFTVLPRFLNDQSYSKTAPSSPASPWFFSSIVSAFLSLGSASIFKVG